MSGDAQQHRLPAGVKPTHYDILIKTDLEKLEFRGIAKIDLEISADTDELVFNISQLAIESIALEIPDNNHQLSIDLANLSLDEKPERGTIALPFTLKSGKRVRLIVIYKHKLLNSMKGYYYSQYKVQGQQRYYTLTQFEATSARAAFPCWDEPAIKATFSVTMVSKSNTVNISNMPITSEVECRPNSFFPGDESQGEWKCTKFETTPKMSTYLVAFANGDFKHIEGSYTSPLSGKVCPLRIYATEDIIHQTQFALDVKARSIVHYEKVFGIEYALPKLDTLVAHDFDAGAMENWGLITGRTTAMLLDPERADLRAKQTIAVTQSHEVAHMWFGNIATMKWWDNLWLNEGFATLMGEVVILNKLFPEWKVYSGFYNAHTTAALSLDSRPSSHPVQVNVPNASDIEQIFDALSYSKSASILRMLSVYAGEEKFLEGVSIYLNNHLYGNTVAEDLWAGIQEATGLDIVTLMNNWTSKIGYPVLTVTETEDGIHIRQDRFFITGRAGEEDNQTIWHIPLGVITANAKGEPQLDNQALLTAREMTYKLDTSRLWKLNAGSAGFYRVFYPPEHMIKLGKEAASPNSILTTEDRLGILDDAMALATSGYCTTSSVLDFISRLQFETEYLVWEGITRQLKRVYDSRVDKEDKDGLQDLLRTLVTPLVKRLGYEYSPEEHSDTIKLRTLSIEAAARAGLPEVVNKLREWFDIYLSTRSDSHIPPDLVRITFGIASQYGGKREWEEAKRTFLNPSNPTIQRAAVYAMTSTQEQALINEMFSFVLKDAPSNKVIYFFLEASTNKKIGRTLFTFFLEHYTELYDKLGITQTLPYLLHFISDVLTTYEDARELEEFFKDKDITRIDQSLGQALDIIRAKAAWLEKSKDDVKEWLLEWRRENKIEEGISF